MLEADHNSPILENRLFPSVLCDSVISLDKVQVFFHLVAGKSVLVFDERPDTVQIFLK